MGPPGAPSGSITAKRLVEPLDRWYGNEVDPDPTGTPGLLSVDERHESPGPKHIRLIRPPQGATEHRLLTPDAVTVGPAHPHDHRRRGDPVEGRERGASPHDQH